MSEIKDIIAKNLTNLRIKKQLTQIELAQKINYTDKSISKWEHGDATPPIDVLKELADLYGVTLDYLVSEEPQENYDKIYASKKKLYKQVYHHPPRKLNNMADSNYAICLRLNVRFFNSSLARFHLGNPSFKHNTSDF